jgi:hypothetical protein
MDNDEQELLEAMAKVVDGGAAVVQSEYEEQVRGFLNMPVGALLGMLDAMATTGKMLIASGRDVDMEEVMKPIILLEAITAFAHGLCQGSVARGLRTNADALESLDALDLPEDVRTYIRDVLMRDGGE